MAIAPYLRTLANDGQAGSLSRRFRAHRFELFEKTAATLPRPLSILDVGGTTEFWESRGWAGRDDVTITLVNLTVNEQRHGNVIPTVGDATRLDYPDQSIDLVFSNSVIEHLFTLDNQRAMAEEVRRVGRAYWVQTPNFWFPIEPHFLAPGWQWLPKRTRVAILQRHTVGWNTRCPERAHAERIVGEHRLMRHGELAELFPEARIVPERLAGLVKSWTAVHGLAA